MKYYRKYQKKDLKYSILYGSCLTENVKSGIYENNISIVVKNKNKIKIYCFSVKKVYINFEQKFKTVG